MHLLRSRSARFGLSLAVIALLWLVAWASVAHIQRLIHPFPVVGSLLGGFLVYAWTGLLRRALALGHEGWKRLLIVASGVISIGGGLLAARIPLYNQEPLAALAVFLTAGLLAGIAALILGLSVLWIIDGFRQAGGGSPE